MTHRPICIHWWCCSPKNLSPIHKGHMGLNQCKAPYTLQFNFSLFFIVHHTGSKFTETDQITRSDQTWEKAFGQLLLKTVWLIFCSKHKGYIPMYTIKELSWIYLSWIKNSLCDKITPICINSQMHKLKMCWNTCNRSLTLVPWT